MSLSWSLPLPLVFPMNYISDLYVLQVLSYHICRVVALFILHGLNIRALIPNARAEGMRKRRGMMLCGVPL